jgi:hypothetical protein
LGFGGAAFDQCRMLLPLSRSNLNPCQACVSGIAGAKADVILVRARYLESVSMTISGQSKQIVPISPSAGENE